jgi:MFS family permease
MSADANFGSSQSQPYQAPQIPSMQPMPQPELNRVDNAPVNNFTALGADSALNNADFNMNVSATGVGASRINSGKIGQYGFGFQPTTGLERGSRIVMNAAVNDSTEGTAGDDEKAALVPELSAAEQEKEELAKNFKPGYAYFVLFIVLVCRIMVQWHRKGLTYAYGYTGLGITANNGIYEIATAYPQLKQWYGLLAGLIYTIPYSFFGLVAGKISDSVNRKFFLGLVIILASATMGISGAVNSFFVLSVMRVFHGMLNSSSNPLSFSLIADYFPPDKRATANSIIQAGNYIGVGVSSLSILLISKFGWRTCYMIMCGLGTVFGLATMALIKEPERGRYLDSATKQKELEKKEKEAEEAKLNNKNPLRSFVDNIGLVFTLPCARNTLIASSLRNFGGMIVSSFLPVFFGRNFPAFKAEYAMLNAAALSICGLTASLAGGIIADKFEKKTYMTKALLCISGCFLSPFLIALGTLSTGNFYLSVLCYALKVLVSGTYSGPAITMIQNTSPLSVQGSVVSVYFFCITMAQTISPAIFGFVANKWGALANPALYGPIITAFVAVSYLSSIPFWWKAGKAYEKHMVEKDEA